MKRITWALACSVFVFSAHYAFASTTDGTVDATDHYAWSENVGWIDFGSSAGNVHITDAALTGSAYSENVGWITLNPPSYGGVTNDGAGNLSGYAWGENVGWVDFSKVTIGSDGVFAGDAYSENIGWITFGTGNNKVSTDWRPTSARTDTSSASVSVSTPAANGGALSYGVGQGVPNPLPGAVSSPIITAISTTVTSIPNYSGLSVPQIQSVISRLNSFGADQSTLARITAILSSSPSTGTSVGTVMFPHNLSLYVVGPDVLALQRYLNTNGFRVTESGPGSPGHEVDVFGLATYRALIRFQSAHGLPTTGYFGPLTRNFITTMTP